jgi:hypothetical protein
MVGISVSFYKLYLNQGVTVSCPYAPEAYGGPSCFLQSSPYKYADKSIIFWSNSFTADQYSSFPLSINVVISLLVNASNITPLSDPEKHPNDWCLAVIRIWEGGYEQETGYLSVI